MPDNLSEFLMWGLLAYVGVFFIFWMFMVVLLAVMSPMGMGVLSGH